MTGSSERRIDRIEATLERIADQVEMLAVHTVEEFEAEKQARIKANLELHQKLDVMRDEFRRDMSEVKETTKQQAENITRLAGSMAEIKETTKQQAENITRLVRVVEMLLSDRTA